MCIYEHPADKYFALPHSLNPTYPQSQRLAYVYIPSNLKHGFQHYQIVPTIAKGMPSTAKHSRSPFRKSTFPELHFQDPNACKLPLIGLGRCSPCFLRNTERSQRVDDMTTVHITFIKYSSIPVTPASAKYAASH